MGYYTKYSLEVIPDSDAPSCEHLNPKGAKFCMYCGKKIEFVSIHGRAVNAIVKICGSAPFDDSCKWYSHEKDMSIVSKEFPNHVLKLMGEGEESGDIWVKYFKDGKVQVCKAKITFDAFDESKLSIING